MRRHWIRPARAWFVLVLPALLVVPSLARCEQDPASVGSIPVGSKVRLTAPTTFPGSIEGMVMQTDRESLLIGMSDERPLRVSRHTITRLEIAGGRRRHTKTGLIIGTATGVLLVAAVAAIPKDQCGPPGEPTTQMCLDDRRAVLALGIPSAALTGAGIGALVKGDRWLPVPLEKARLSLAPIRGHGVGLSLAVRF